MQMQTAISNYLIHTFGIQPDFKGVKEHNVLPIYLLHRFELMEGNLFNKEVVFAFDKGNTRLTPLEIKKSMDAIKKGIDKPVIYCTKAIKYIEVIRLIAYQVQFIVPGKQVYLPEFMIYINKRDQNIPEQKDRFTPVAQQAFLYFMHNKTPELYLGEIALKLGYSPMSISRALNELLGMKLVKKPNDGRLSYARLLDDRKTAWEKGKKYLFNPVETVRFVTPEIDSTVRGVYESGITALSRYSMLADDDKKTYACTKKELIKMLDSNFCKVVDFLEDSEIKLEIWKYNPGQFASGKTVDELSIYIQLKDDPDERVQQALEEMMGNFQW